VTNSTEKTSTAPGEGSVFALQRIDPNRLGVAFPPAVVVDLETVVGRDARSAQVLLDDPSVSRQHVMLRFLPRSGHFQVVDLGSSNGTYVNGQRVDRHEVDANDVLRLGDFLMVLVELPEAVLRRARPERSVCVPGRSAAALEADAVLCGMPPGGRVLVGGETGTGRSGAVRCLAERLGHGDRVLRVHGSALREPGWEISLLAWARGVAMNGGGLLHLDDLGFAPREAQERLEFLLETPTLARGGAVTVAATVGAPTRTGAPAGLTDGLVARLAPPFVCLPPLRQRREDVVAVLVSCLSALGRRATPSATAGFVERLLLHPWPANLSEIRALVELLAAGGRLEARLDEQDLPGRLLPDNGAAARRPVEVAQLVDALRASNGNVSAAARALDLSRRHVYRLLDRYAVDPSEWRYGTIPDGEAL